MPKQKKESGETGPKKQAKCLRCSRTKTGNKHTGEQREFARVGRQARLLSRAVLQPFAFKDKEAHPSYFKGSRDAFVEARHLLAVKNGDKLLRVEPEEKKDDGRIIAHHWRCGCGAEASGGSYAVVRRGMTHSELHRSAVQQEWRRSYRDVPLMSLR